MGIGSFISPGIDFTAYRTDDWGPADALPTGDPTKRPLKTRRRHAALISAPAGVGAHRGLNPAGKARCVA
jgi:hypothetical protein